MPENLKRLVQEETILTKTTKTLGTLQQELRKTLRMVCRSCGVPIRDDKYFVCYDPDDPDNNLYYHSKGECAPRRTALLDIRKQWISQYQEAKKSVRKKKK